MGQLCDAWLTNPLSRSKLSNHKSEEVERCSCEYFELSKSIISGQNAVGDKPPGISGRALHVFAFELVTVAIQLGQYLQRAMVTESSHTRINTLPPYT